MEDIKIKCGCGAEIVWTVGEQEFYKSRDMSAPKRCKPCVVKKRAHFEQKERELEEKGKQQNSPFYNALKNLPPAKDLLP